MVCLCRFKAALGRAGLLQGWTDQRYGLNAGIANSQIYI